MKDRMRGAALVAHSGGPTPVINASLAGVVEECRRHAEFTALYGARSGVEGILQDNLIDLFAQDPALIRVIGESPGSALGSSRLGLSAGDYHRMIDLFRVRGIRYVFYTGGNGSMDTALNLSRTAGEAGYELAVIGVPKTIDNDIAVTDHTPGYPSAARFAAFAVRDVGEDSRALPAPVTVLETVGRNTGWVTAATSLARRHPDDAPHLIYLPERPVSETKLLADVESVYRRLGRVVIAVCEGQLDDKGMPFGAHLLDAGDPRRKLASNLGYSMARLIMQGLNVRARSEKPGLLGRSSAFFTPALDRAEAKLCGEAAVRAAIEGSRGVMVILRREAGPEYRCSTALTALGNVAGIERPLPAEWIHPDSNDVLPAFGEYAAPLVGEVPPLPRLC